MNRSQKVHFNENQIEFLRHSPCSNTYIEAVLVGTLLTFLNMQVLPLMSLAMLNFMNKTTETIISYLLFPCMQ